MLIRSIVAAFAAALIVPVTLSSPVDARRGAAGRDTVAAAAARQPATSTMTPEQIIAELRRPENSSGNIADGVEAVTGGRARRGRRRCAPS